MGEGGSWAIVGRGVGRWQRWWQGRPRTVLAAAAAAAAEATAAAAALVLALSAAAAAAAATQNRREERAHCSARRRTVSYHRRTTSPPVQPQRSGAAARGRRDAPAHRTSPHACSGAPAWVVGRWEWRRQVVPERNVCGDTWRAWECGGGGVVDRAPWNALRAYTWWWLAES